MNNEVPEECILYDPFWTEISKQLQKCVKDIVASIEFDPGPNKITFKKAAGRGKHHDFELLCDGKVVINIEFKYGATCVTDTPQFVSPMKPSQYMSRSFEEDFYDELPKIFEDQNIPDKPTWMSQIHGNMPKCMKQVQDKYYAGCKASSKFTNEIDDIVFYERCKLISDESIETFLSRDDVTLCSERLSKYFIDTQEKTYIMYKDGEFSFKHISPDEFIIESWKKEPENHRFVATTKTGRTLRILLRWKNGNGIAFPAFQISLVK